MQGGVSGIPELLRSSFFGASLSPTGYVQGAGAMRGCISPTELGRSRLFGSRYCRLFCCLLERVYAYAAPGPDGTGAHRPLPGQTPHRTRPGHRRQPPVSQPTLRRRHHGPGRAPRPSPAGEAPVSPASELSAGAGRLPRLSWNHQPPRERFHTGQAGQPLTSQRPSHERDR